jgi:hypothetical protein
VLTALNGAVCTHVTVAQMSCLIHFVHLLWGHVHRCRPQPLLSARLPAARILARGRQDPQAHPRQPLRPACRGDRGAAAFPQGREAGCGRGVRPGRALCPVRARGRGAGDDSPAQARPGAGDQAFSRARPGARDGGGAGARSRLQARDGARPGRGGRVLGAGGRARPGRRLGRLALPGPRLARGAAAGDRGSARWETPEGGHAPALRRDLHLSGGAALPAGRARLQPRRQSRGRCSWSSGC